MFCKDTNLPLLVILNLFRPCKLSVASRSFHRNFHMKLWKIFLNALVATVYVEGAVSRKKGCKR